MGPDVSRRLSGLRARLLLAVVPLAVAIGCQRPAAPEPVGAAPASAPAPAPPPDVSPPTQPTNLEVTGAPGAADLTWNGSGDDVGVEGYDVFRGETRIARVATPQARETGLSAGDRCCYHVVAFDAAGNRSPPSAEACAVVPDVTPPSVPAALAAILVAPTEVALRWNASTDDVGVAGYEVVRGSEVVATVREPNARFAGTPPGRRFCWAVRALDFAGNRSEATAPACVATPDVTPPTQPQQLVVEARPGRVELRWTASTDDVGVATYEVQRDGAVVAKGPKTEASEPGLRAAARYCYAVRALDAAGNASPWTAPACATPPDVTPPSTPAEVAAVADGETVVKLRWAAASDDVGVVRYEVLRDGAVVATAETLEAAMRGLRAAVEYCHAVRACDAAGNCSRPSAPGCATTPDLTPPAQVAGVAAEPDSDTQITVRWKATQDNVGVVRYRVREGDRLVAEMRGDETRTVVEGLRPATRHCYVVAAEDAAGNVSKPSAPACATTPDLVPPTPPPSAAAAPRSGTRVAVAWKASTDDVGVAGYEVVRKGEAVATTALLRTEVADLAPETEYCFSVRAFDAAGNRSEPSNPQCVRTPEASAPVAPGNLRADVTQENELQLSWEPAPGQGAVYVVYWDGGRGRGDRRIGTTRTTKFKVFGTAAAERHCYTVTALDPELDHESPQTIPVCGAAARRLSVEGAAQRTAR